MQFDLFGKSNDAGWEEVVAADAQILLLRNFLPAARSGPLFDTLLGTVPWRQDKIRLFGREHCLPRLQQWYGDEGRVYRWSGIEMVPEPWTAALWQVKCDVEAVSRCSFNSLLINLYRDGNDTVSWHSDDEPGLGTDPVIASVSLGASREFVLRHRFRRDLHGKISLTLNDGSLLLMAGSTQQCWEHSVPRRMGVTDARINLTFRNIVAHQARLSRPASG